MSSNYPKIYANAGKRSDPIEMQKSNDERLNTASKEVVGAINEIYALVGGDGSGVLIEVDDDLSLSSANPVMNRIITAELNKKQDAQELVDSALTNLEIEAILQ